MDITTMTILISDDSILVRKKMRDYLTSLGCLKLVEAVDGEEAVRAYKACKADLVFMDIVMPKKDGVQALTEILAFDPKAKVVISSSVGTQSNLKKAISIGAHDFLQKPIDYSQIGKIIANLKNGGGK